MVESSDHRNKFIEALKSISTPIEINGIFEGAEIVEDHYSTHALCITDGAPQLIIGDDCSANEDYLTTLRNSVGQLGKYENYGVLYVLSKTVLSSLFTASLNLEGLGGPLHPNQIVDQIKADVGEIITKDLERIYLSKHLDCVSELIGDGTANLFDFESMMTVLSAGTIKGLFNDLEMFEDESIYSNLFNPKDEEMAERVAINKALYDRVSSIMNGDEEDKEKELCKFLDEKLSKKIANQKEPWNKIDLKEYLDSIDRRAEKETIQLKDVSLAQSRPGVSLVWNCNGKTTKATRNYIVVCDLTGDAEQEVVITFNQSINSVPKFYKSQGGKIRVPVGDRIEAFKIGLNDNHHDFYILRLPCDRSFFKEIKECFTLNKKGDLTVKVPAELESITFGNGASKVELPEPPIWVWSKDERLYIPIEEDKEEDKESFTVDFDKKKLGVTLKFNESKPLPPLGPDSFPQSTLYTGVEQEEIPFKKVTDGEVERGVFSHWRPFLEKEQIFVETGCSAIELVFDDLTKHYEPVPNHLQLDPSIDKALARIYKYFKQKKTISSLCPIDEELIELYKDYCSTVLSTVEKISVGQSMKRKDHNLTRLGTMFDGRYLYMSPFHPMIVAYWIECHLQSKGQKAPFAKKLLTPFYLIPYLTYKNVPMRPYSTTELEEIRNWLVFENANSKPQERANDITTKMVRSKMEDFIRHFPYLFQDKESPIIISSIGLYEDSNLIKGIVEFIKSQYIKGVQRIELHEYVDDMKNETFFEKLNRMDSIENIIRELQTIYSSKEKSSFLESKGEYVATDIVHQLFTRMSFYKHDIKKCKDEIGYCHIAFYQMTTGSEYVNFPTKETRTELAYNGLISIPSTLKKDGNYFIGFGSKGVRIPEGYIHPMAIAYNNLYGNEKNEGANAYATSLSVTKKFAFNQSHLLDSIYNNANWVTFLNPEVDIDFFYHQDLYIVHYTDQYTINAKYDSITVTKHIGLYENILKKSFKQYALSEDSFPSFNEVMKNYFNCLNGRWMLRLVNQPEYKVREKMSLVAASIVMQKFLGRNPGIIWIPLSLEETLRVTGEIGLKMESIFSKKSLGAKGVLSDDLLMIGLDGTNPNSPTLYFYPIEVKVSNTTSLAEKGAKQVSHTWLQFKNHVFTSEDFETKIYRTFFASQLLVNSEKLFANDLITPEVYEAIESCRYALLNLNWNIKEILPIKEMGVAAVVSFYSNANHSFATKLTDDVPVCEIHFSERECLEFISNSSNDLFEFLNEGIIQIEEDAKQVVSSTSGLVAQMEEESQEAQFDSIDEDETPSAPQSMPGPDIKEEDIEMTSSSESKIVPEEASPQEQSWEQGIRIVVGRARGGNQEVVFEPNNTKMVSHPNMGVVGTMGTGKTQFARSLVAQFTKESMHNVGGHPVGVLVFDYKGDYKDKNFLEVVGGQCYRTSYPFNPLKLIYNEEAEGMNLPAVTADRIADSFAKAYGLGLKQQSSIKKVILETYADAGITMDNSTWNKVPPTMSQVIDKYFSLYDVDDKAYALFDKLRDYTIFASDSSKCVSIFEWLKGVRVIDLTLYSDDTKRVIVSLILDLLCAEMKQLGASIQENGFRELRAMILVDEAHQFLKKDFNSFRSLISEGRMFGVGMILSTQNISDFKTNKEDYSQFILSWVIHHVNSISKSDFINIFGTDSYLDNYMSFIHKAKIFESLCKIGSMVKGIRDIPYYELIETDERFTQPDQL